MLCIIKYNNSILLGTVDQISLLSMTSSAPILALQFNYVHLKVVSISESVDSLSICLPEDIYCNI